MTGRPINVKPTARRRSQEVVTRRVTLKGLVGSYVAFVQTACAQSAELSVFDVTRAPFNADATGQRNATQAFAAASRAIERAGGGILMIPGGNYRVGQQARMPQVGQDWSFRPEPIISISNCTLPVEIRGQGARLFCDEGLRYGSFDAASGRRLDRTLPFVDPAARAAPYIAMISLIANRGGVTVRDLELDGRADRLVIGGQWNDTGIQIPASGIQAFNNRSLTVVGVTSHDHGLDGIMIGWEGLAPDSSQMAHRLSDCHFTGNGRQGLSWVGGNSLRVERCTFSGSGRGRISSPPGAGIDIEAETSICRNGVFIDCVVTDNAGVGVLAHAPSDNAGMLFSNCQISGTTNWAAWPASPEMEFKGCQFWGGVTNAHGNSDPARATQFSQCVFTARPTDSSNRGSFRQNYLTAEIDNALNVLFDRCRFDSNGDRTAGVTYINGGAIIRDCEFRQDGAGLAVIRGHLLGSTTVRTAGRVDFSGAKLLGPVTLNGRRIDH